MAEDLPPGVVRFPGTSHRSGETDPEASWRGECRHPRKPDEQYCHGHKKQSHGLCHRPAGAGTSHVGIGRCKLHGGSLPNVEKAAHEALVRRRAERELAILNTAADPVDNPLAALAELAGEAIRFKNVLAAHVAELATLRYSAEDDEGRRSEQIRGEVVLYERALADVGRLLVAIGRLNIDDRLVRIAEREADIVVRAVDAGLTAAGVTPDDMDRVRAAVGREIRRLAG